MSFNIIWVALCLCFSTLVHSLENHTTDSLDSFLQDSAFKTLVLRGPPPHPGDLYKTMLPANLSGMDVSVVRLSSRRFWNVGANFSNFQIPPGTQTTPHVKWLTIVYQDLGNWSFHYYNVPGYSLVSSVVGFMVFNASNEKAESVEKISLNTRGKSIVIRFSASTFPNEMARCVEFGSRGTFQLSDINERSVCYSRDQGHFSIVVPLESKGENQRTKTRRLWYLWIIGSVLGLGVLTLAGYFGLLSIKVLKTKKIQVMERQAQEDLALETVWVGRSKMPSANVTRTQPILENGGFP